MTPAMQAVDRRSVPGLLFRQGAQDRRGQHQEQASSPACMAKLLDGPAALRRYMIENLVMEGFTLRRGDDTTTTALEAFIRKAAIGVWHASCTCRMGRDDDPMAVADRRGACGRRGAARGRCLDLPGGALRQHQFPDADDGGEDRGRDLGGGMMPGLPDPAIRRQPLAAGACGRPLRRRGQGRADRGGANHEVRRASRGSPGFARCGRIRSICAASAAARRSTARWRSIAWRSPCMRIATGRRSGAASS